MEKSYHFLESVSHADLVTGHVLAKLCSLGFSPIISVTVLTLFGLLDVGANKNIYRTHYLRPMCRPQNLLLLFADI